MKRSLLLSVLLLAGGPSPARSQLRPLEPLDWRVFGSATTSVRFGAGVHGGQRASLAGTRGTLTELGNFQASYRSGRIAVEAGGTLLRLFTDDTRFAAAFGGALDSEGPDRSDSGDYRVGTTILLTPESWSSTMAGVRFGARLPTTNNRVGLDRDQTDFFALVAGRSQSRGVLLTGETGIGIHGSRYPNFEQSDLFLYAVGAELPIGAFTPRLSLLGQMDWSAGQQLRANEDLAEIRAGARVGELFWVEAEVVRGLATFSPELGLLVTVGRAW